MDQVTKKGVEDMDATAWPEAGMSASAVEAAATELRPPSAISVANLSFSYASGPGRPGKKVLDGVSWDVPQGSFTLIMGPTGCGKTTLLRNLKPELVPTGAVSGDVVIFGKKLSELGTRESAETIGYVAQNPETQIVCDTVWHELAFGLENLGMDTQTMRRRVAEIAHFFGIEPWIDKQTDQLSGGQKQIMNLASVLALRPRILLLDEPTSQLDPVAARNFLHMLFRVNRELGLTVVMVSHDPEMAVDYATDAIWVENGCIQVRDMAAFRKDVHQRTISAQFQELPQPQTEPALDVRDVHVRYSRNAPFVLRGCDLQVRRGSIHTLVGGNGAGKSTLLSAAAGTLKAERGRLRNTLAASQAYLPQDPKALFVCDTVADELAVWQKSAGYTQEDIAAVAARFRLEGVLDQHPYDLSGGQQQLLAFAKILLTKPQLILMDEPTKGLDVLSRYLMADALCAVVQSDATILMASHDLAFVARVADTVSLLFDGQITCTQPAAAFFTENLFYRPTVDWFFATWERPENPQPIFSASHKAVPAVLPR